MVNSINSNQINNQIAFNRMQQLGNAQQNFNANVNVPENNIIASKVEDAKKSPITSIGLFAASWAFLSKAADLFNSKTRGEYSSTIYGKIGNFGDKVAQTSVGKSISNFFKPAINGIKNYWNKNNESNIILRWMKNPSKREWKFASAGPSVGYIDEVCMDVIDVMRGFKNAQGEAGFLKAFGQPYEYFEKMNSGAYTHAKELEDGLSKAIKYCKANGIKDTSLLNDIPMFKGIKLPWFLSRKATLTESLNKLHVAKGLKNPMQKTALGKLLPKWTSKVVEGMTNGTAGGKLVIAMQATMLADAIYRTYKAPKGEKLSTFMESMTNDVAMYMMIPLYSQFLNRVGGLKTFGWKTADIQKYNKALEEFNAAAKAGTLSKAAHKTGKQAIKKIAKNASKWYLAPIRWIGKLSDFGCGRIYPHLQKGKGLTNFVKKAFYHIKGAGGVGRLLFSMLVLAPMLAKPVVKCSHLIFGKPTKSVLDSDSDDKTAQKTAQNQLTQENLFAPVNGTNKNAIGLTNEEMALLKQKGLNDEQIVQVALYKKQMEAQQKETEARLAEIKNAKPLPANSLLKNTLAAERLQGARASSSAPRKYVPSSKSNIPQPPIPPNVLKALKNAELVEQEANATLKG